MRKALRAAVIGTTGSSLLACSVGNPVDARPKWWVTMDLVEGDCPAAPALAPHLWSGLELDEDDGEQGIQLNYDIGESAPWIWCYEADGDALDCLDFGFDVDGLILHHDLVVERPEDGLIEGELSVAGTCGDACEPDQAWTTCTATYDFRAERVLDPVVRTITTQESCEAWGDPSEATAGEAVRLTIVNNNSSEHRVVWFDAAGAETEITRIAPGSYAEIDTYVGHSFGVDDAVTGTCRLVFQVEGPDELRTLDGAQR